MFDSAILDVAVGLVAIYLILSLVVSAAGEKWAAITRRGFARASSARASLISSADRRHGRCGAQASTSSA